jgi:hypothetical protein
MKIKSLLFIIATAALASCSTAYKSGQTPDDLYYAKPKAIVNVNTDRYEKIDNSSAFQDRQIRMAIYDRRWRDLDYEYDYNYSYSPYSYGYTYGYYYNPYYYCYPVYAPGIKFVNPKNTTIRTTNLNAYNNTITNSTFDKGTRSSIGTYTPRYNNSNSTTTRRPVNYDNRTYTDRNSTTTPDRSYNTNTNSSSSSSSSSSPSSAPSSGSVSRPGRN